MAIFRGTGGSGNSTDDSIVSAVTEQAGIATTKADEASASATTATTKASEASASATTATTKADEANTAKNAAETARDSAQTYRGLAFQSAVTAGSHANAAEASAQTANNSSVQTVAGISTEVQNLDNIKTDITSVNTIKSDVTTVAGISSNVTTVAADASDIGTVATNIANVNNVGNNIANVNAVHSNASNINTVAADASDIGTVSSNISNVNTVAGISSDVTTVAGLESKMDTVIADASDIGAVANNIGDVSTVAGINADVDTVAGIAAKVTTVADNISDVQSADTNAANASASASQAANSATAAGTSATTASTKATEASNSATAASNSATTATTKATEAAGSATTATTKATEASTSATNAATSATTATTKASEAASSATAASGSATTATTKASEADASANSAASSATDATNASNTWSDFYTTYLGAADAPPTADVQGNALQTGAFYYDTGAGSNTVGLYVYNGSSWVYSTNYNNVTAPYSLAQDLATNGNDISFGDNDKANFGASDDLQIYHDGSNSYIDEVGTGTLRIRGHNQVRVTDTSDNIAAIFKGNAESTLYHNNSAKLATTSTGIDVTGGSTGDVAKFTGAHPSRNLLITNYTSGGEGSSYAINANSGYGEIKLQTVSKDRIKVVNNGDISFYEDTGTTPKFFWDASAESLGIGTSSPSADLHINNTAGSELRIDTAGGSNADSVLNFRENGTDRASLYWDGVDNDLYLETTFGDIALMPTGNVGIGTSSPSDLLHIQSTSPIIRLTDSDTGADSIISASSSVGALSISADNGNEVSNTFINFKTDGSERLRIDSSGNVGVGTTSPANKLHVQRNGTAISGLGASTVATFQSTGAAGSSTFVSILAGSTGSTGQAAINFGDADDEDIGRILYRNVDNSMAFTTNTQERMRIDSSGNVGIGTSSPSDKLEVASSSSVNIKLNNTGNSTSLLLGAQATAARLTAGSGDKLGLGANDTADGLVLDTSNKVGIGTSSPSSKLTVAGDIEQTTGDLKYTGGINWDIAHHGAGQNIVFSTTPTGGSATQRMRIDSSGNLLVGKTSASSATVGFQAGQDGFIAATRASAQPLVLNRTTNDGIITDFRKDGSTVGSIGNNGSGLYLDSVATGYLSHNGTRMFNWDASQFYPQADGAKDLGHSSYRWRDLYRSGSTYSTSDRNKKQDIRDLTDAEARVAVVAKGSLKAFRYIDTVEAEGDDANIHFGIIAQDLKAAFEAEGLNADSYQVLKTSTYTDDDGVEQTTYSVCYENLLAFIISAI